MYTKYFEVNRLIASSVCRRPGGSQWDGANSVANLSFKARRARVHLGALCNPTAIHNSDYLGPCQERPNSSVLLCTPLTASSSGMHDHRKNLHSSACGAAAELCNSRSTTAVNIVRPRHVIDELDCAYCAEQHTQRCCSKTTARQARAAVSLPATGSVLDVHPTLEVLERRECDRNHRHHEPSEGPNRRATEVVGEKLATVMATQQRCVTVYGTSETARSFSSSGVMPR